MLGLIAPGNYIGTLAGATLKTVTTAGTEVQLSTTEVPCEGIILQALESNTGANGGYIVYGGSDVVAAAASRKGIALAAGESVFLPVKDVSVVWVDATDDGMKACYLPLR
jgi:hypothetical protein